MINKWINHAEILRIHELLVHVDHMRAPTVEQLASVMGLSAKTILHVYIPKLRKLNKNYLETRKLKGRGSKNVYSLGSAGCDVVSSIYGRKIPYYPYTGAQDGHFVGINNILMRLIQKIGLPAFKASTQWLFTSETRDYLKKPWSKLLQYWIQEGDISEEDATEMLHQLPEPDARLTMALMSFWLEFDNDTESPEKLREKLDDYIATLVPLQNRDPIIWVVTAKNPARRFELEKLWKEVQQWPEQEQRKEQYGEHFFFPEMYFFTEGEETELLAAAAGKTENLIEM